MALEVATDFIELNTNGYNEIIDLTGSVQQKLEGHGFEEGFAMVFTVGSTCGVSTLEFEPGLAKTDVKEMLSKLAPYGENYEHNKTWGDDNGASHLRSTLMGSSLSIPFQDGKLLLGTWQQIVFMDFDTRARNRRAVVQFYGRKKGAKG